MRQKFVINEKVTVGDNSLIIDSVIENNCEIDRRNYIHHSHIGAFTYTGFNTYIGYAKIGRYCSISRFVDIGGFDHSYTCASTLPEYKLHQLLGKTVSPGDVEQMELGSDVWIGTGAAICRRSGIRVGNGAIIAAGAVVVNDVPEYSVVAGVPAKVIKYRFSEKIRIALSELKWWDWPADVVVRYFDLLKAEMNDDVMMQLRQIGKTHGKM
jgi:acetyltransferase-like isoleucine patch superfamily enzyme